MVNPIRIELFSKSVLSLYTHRLLIEELTLLQQIFSLSQKHGRFSKDKQHSHMDGIQI
jgi:hypothetical protein